MNRTVLFVEDDEIMRENTAEILSLAQYDVVTACNGKEGTIKAKESPPDIIISDIMMPELDGYGVLHVLSKDPATASIPFIFLTAKAEKSEHRKGMELGADDYIIKPFENTELLNAVETRLKKTDALKKEYSRDVNSLNEFLTDAKGMKELEDLSVNRPISIYKRKEVIFHTDDKPHYLYFINKGKVKTYKSHDDGKELITNVYKEGEFFGYFSLFDDKPYTDSALVLEKSEIYKIPKSDFLSLMYKNRDVANKFIKLLSNHIEEQEKQLLRLAYDTVRKRTAEALLNLHRQYNGPSSLNGNGKEKGSSIMVTREDLAGMAGTATETVIRCLSDFKQDKLIEAHGREITILNLEGLKAIH